MRSHCVEAIEYVSARDVGEGINVALFGWDVFVGTEPTSKLNLICQLTGENTMFIDDYRDVHQYPFELYMEDGKLPCPKS